MQRALAPPAGMIASDIITGTDRPCALFAAPFSAETPRPRATTFQSPGRPRSYAFDVPNAASAMPNSRPRWDAISLTPLSGAVAALLILAAILLFSPNFRDVGRTTGPFGGDFLQEWIGGRIVLEGDAARLYDLDYVKSLEHDPAVIGYSWNADRYLPIVYPPFYYVLVSPLALLPMKTAAYVWTVLMAGAFLATAAVLGQVAGEKRSRLGWMIPAAMLFAPMLENFASGQKATVVLLILSTTYLAMVRERSFLAGLAFGLLAFKPQLGLAIFAAMLWKRQWRFLLGAATTGAALLCASLLVGLQPCLAWVRITLGAADYVHTAGYELEKAHCWYGMFSLLCGERFPLMAKGATLAAGAATCFVLLPALRGPLRFGSPRFALQFSALAAASMLVSPHLLSYDLSIALLPMALVAFELADDAAILHGRRRKLIWMLALLFAAGSFSTPLARVSGVQTSVALLFAMTAVVCGACREERGVSLRFPRTAVRGL
jgi:hypothetical protein